MGGEYLAENCYATGNVTASATMARIRAGALFGNVTTNYDPFILKNCYSAGNVSASSKGSSTGDEVYVGGIVGAAKGVSVSFCYSAGNISASVGTSYSGMGKAYAGAIVGGLLAGTNNTTLNKCYRASEAIITATGTKFSLREDGTEESLTAIQTRTFYEAELCWAESIWDLTDGAHPTLK